jgi:hypothetical protein
MNTIFLYILIPAFGALLILFFVLKGKVKDLKFKHREKKNTDGLKVLLYENDRSYWDISYISEDIVTDIIHSYGSLGRLWTEEGVTLHHINKYSDGGIIKYRPIEVCFIENAKHPPEEIGEIIKQEELDCLSTKQEGGVFQKYGNILFFCGVALFILFIWSVSILK